MKSSPLIFVSQLKSYLGEDSAVTGQEVNMRTAIEVATSMAESIVGRSFLRQEVSDHFRSVKNYRSGYTLKFNPIDTPTGAPFFDVTPIKVYLKSTPVSNTHPVKVYYSVQQDFTEELPSTYYSVDYDEGSVLLKFPMEDANRAVKVTYTGGYLDSVDTGVVENLSDPTQERSVGFSIPSDLRHAALVQASLIHAHIQASLCSTNEVDRNAFTSSSFNETYKIHPTFSLLLSKYRKQLIRFI